MLCLSIRNNTEIEIETPSGIVRFIFYKRNNGGRGVRIFTGDTKSNRWPITRTNLVRKVTKLRSPTESKDQEKAKESLSTKSSDSEVEVDIPNHLNGRTDDDEIVDVRNLTPAEVKAYIKRKGY
jgi:hypothetical protein